MYNKQNPADTNSIGFRIRELRQKKGLKQTELAHLIDCAPNTITEWEKRKGRAPGKKLLGRVAQVLEVPIGHLLGIEKIENPQIPCYKEVLSEGFVWSNSNKAKYYIEVPQHEYSHKRFSLKILDDLLEPTISQGEYAIFEKLPPEDGDIVIVCFPGVNNKAIIRMWRQKENLVIISETNLYKFCTPYFFEFTQQPSKNLRYTSKKDGTIEVKGKLVAVKKVTKSVKVSSRVNYIF